MRLSELFRSATVVQCGLESGARFANFIEKNTGNHKSVDVNIRMIFRLVLPAARYGP
jgi:hypothetical protein